MNRGDPREGTSRKPQTLVGTMYQKENKARRVQETVFHFGTCLLYRARVVQEGENMTEPAKSSHLRGKRQRNKTNQKSGTRKVHCQQEPGQRQPAPQAPAQGPGSPQRCSSRPSTGFVEIRPLPTRRLLGSLPVSLRWEPKYKV